MSNTNWMDLLAPEGATLVGPDQVEQALAQLWSSAVGAGQDQSGTAAASRVCAANLILVGRPAQWDELSQVLGELAPSYPTRTVALLLNGPGHPRAGSPSSCPSPPDSSQETAGVRASVTALCHVPQAGEPQVCSEQIILRTAMHDPEAIVLTLLPLMESDVPVMVWWTCPPTDAPGLLVRLADLADRLVLDAGPEGLTVLEPHERCAIRELGWYRTYRWRELIAGLWDDRGSRHDRRVREVSVSFVGWSAELHTDAIWLLAFVGGQLDWQPHRRLGADRWELMSPEGVVSAAIIEEPGHHPGLREFSMSAADARWQIQGCPDRPEEYRVIVHGQDLCRLPRSVQIRPPSRAASLAAAFTGRTVDRAFQRAAPLARWLGRQTAPDPKDIV